MQPKKSLGQHWLNDEASLRAIVSAAELKSGETVLEIGPGQGSLTRQLLDSGAKVIAVEKDEKLANKLAEQSLPNLKIETTDILKFDFSKLPPGYKIVANIPYYLTAHLFRALTEIDNKPARAVLLVQKEVAERVCAPPGEMSLLAVAVQLDYLPTLRVVVLAGLFEPPPKVDSQVLILDRRAKSLFENLNEDIFFKLVKAGFSERRKKLRSSLSGGLNLSKTEADQLLERAKIDGGLRAQSLSLENWYKLYSVVSNLPSSPLV